MGKSEKIKSYCDECQGTTNHAILYKKSEKSSDPDYMFERIYFVIECMGCEQVSFMQEDHDYEVSYPDENDIWTHEISVHLYPEPLKNHKPLSEQHLLPNQLRTVYSETIEALKSNCKLLAGVGFRAIIEAICIDKQINGRNLEQKINNLARSRFITDKEAERLHAVRFMGNDSVHEIAVPKERALFVVLEIIEHLLQNLYIIDKHAKPVLETFITNFDDFEELLIQKLKKFKKDDDFPLAKYIDKDVRRLNGQISKFENELIQKIKAGEFELFNLGEVKKFGTNTSDLFQHFIKSK